MLSSNEVYYTDESAQGKYFFKKFSDLIIGDVLKRLVIQERPLQSKLSARDRLGLRLRRAQNGPPTGRPRTAERPCPREGPLGAAGAGRAAPDG